MAGPQDVKSHKEGNRLTHNHTHMVTASPTSTETHASHRCTSHSRKHINTQTRVHAERRCTRISPDRGTDILRGTHSQPQVLAHTGVCMLYTHAHTQSKHLNASQEPTTMHSPLCGQSRARSQRLAWVPSWPPGEGRGRGTAEPCLLLTLLHVGVG